MSIDALTRNDADEICVPESTDEWRSWVSATATRNHVLGDPILDWLDLYGTAKGFKRDDELPERDERTEFTPFIFRQGHFFEEAAVEHLRRDTEVVTIANSPADVRDLDKAIETFEAMKAGVPIIHQGVLRDPERQTYGAPDLLIRSDELARLFPDAIDASEAKVAAPDLDGGAWHYRVADVKFTTLRLSAAGELGNSGSAPAYKLQLFAYSQALGRLQGFEPPVSYLLGRAWTQRKERGANAMERLGPVPMPGTLTRGRLVADAHSEATAWIRRVRAEGGSWKALPEPSIPELYPNSGNQQDGPWHAAKAQIARELEDLTLLWQVGEAGRQKGHAAGVFRWTDPTLTPEIVGISGEIQGPTLQKLLDINLSNDGPPVRPEKITAAEEEWRTEPLLEFYVDFETVSDLADDFSSFPEKGGQTLIFNVGCGHIEDGEWRFASFVVDAITEDDEARIIESWFDHMEAVRRRLAPEGPTPRLIHWSPAEVTTFETAYNSAQERQERSDWASPRWFDFLKHVMRAEPVTVRGAMGFGLKDVAKAMHALGLIETLWGDGPADGMGAMVGAWWCAEEAQRLGVTLPEIALMQEIAAYNEVDCRVMMEIVRYLRAEH